MPFIPDRMGGPASGRSVLLSWKAREYDLRHGSSEMAGSEHGDALSRREAVRGGLNDRQKSVKGSRVLVLGVWRTSKDVDDMRNRRFFFPLKSYEC